MSVGPPIFIYTYTVHHPDNLVLIMIFVNINPYRMTSSANTEGNKAKPEVKIV